MQWYLENNRNNKQENFESITIMVCGIIASNDKKIEFVFGQLSHNLSIHCKQNWAKSFATEYNKSKEI